MNPKISRASAGSLGCIALFMLAVLQAFTPWGISQDFPGAGQPRKLHEGFAFTEGPAYDGHKYLYFTDIPNERIMRTDLQGNLETFLEKSGKCNGLMFDADHNLIACQMRGRLVSIDVDTKEVRVLSDSYQSKPYNACNDLVIDETGGIYFTDPRYGAPEPWPQVQEAVYYRAPDGTVKRLAVDMNAPNGIILSPDEKTLYVVPTMESDVFAFDVLTPGVLGDRRILCELKRPADKSDSGGDGMTVDVDGNLYITTHRGVQVISPRGDLLGVIEFAEQPANCAFGGMEMKTLFATCRTGLYAVEMPIAGHVFPGAVK
jgi:gluconolactonase